MVQDRPPRTTCCRCGGPHTGSHAGYCRSCWAAYMRERKQGLHQAPEFRSCEFCGRSYQPKRRARSIYCSRRCKDHARAPRRERICPHCGEQFETRLSTQMLCSRSCRAAAHRLQSKFRSRVGESTRPGIWRYEIAERDGWICGICGTPVDKNARYPDSGQATLDHIVPVTRGGTNDPSNLRLAHMDCNRSRGNRMEAHASS